jgi:EF hand domain-containing protein
MYTRIITIALLFMLPITSTYSAEGFMNWVDVMKKADIDKDSKVSPSEVVNFKHADRYVGFQPFMASHFSRFDFNNDGYLSMEECREGMKQLDYSDKQVTREFTRDHFGFRGMMDHEQHRDRKDHKM